MNISLVLHFIDLCTFQWFRRCGGVAVGSCSCSSHNSLSASVGGGVGGVGGSVALFGVASLRGRVVDGTI